MPPFGLVLYPSALALFALVVYVFGTWDGERMGGVLIGPAGLFAAPNQEKALTLAAVAVYGFLLGLLPELLIRAQRRKNPPSDGAASHGESTEEDHAAGR